MDNRGSEPGDELEFEVSSLPQRTLRFGERWFGVSVQQSSDTGRGLWYQQRVQVPCAVVAAALIVLVILLLLFVIAAPTLGTRLATLGTRTTPTSPAAGGGSTVVLTTPTPSPYPLPTPIAPAMGSIPTTCTPGSPLVAFAPTDTVPGIGGQGVWLTAAVFFGASGAANLGHGATAKLGSFSPSDYTLAGWPVQVSVLVQDNLTHQITLTGQDLRTTYRLWFSADANNPGAVDEASPLATIDPSSVSASMSDWKIWFGVLYLPGAGCYRLHATWQGGSWTVVFAAGR